MKYSITFKGLPFEPAKRQVIYVENLYDERINALVKDNYQQIKWIFGRANLDFIYLPMFFNDEETKEKVLYYAPYLTTEIIEKTELRSSYLLGYMSHGENRDKITSSLLYSPKKDEEEWIFQGQTIDIDGDGRSLTIQWFEVVAALIEEELSKEGANRIRLHIPVSDEDEGVLYRSDDDWTDEESKVEYSSTPSLWDKFGRELKKFSKKCVEEEGYSETTNEPAPSSLDEILDEDVRETLEELEKKIERLRLLGIPLDVIVAFVARYETVSRLLITDDLRIILPDYNNIEVKMPALYKAVYLLFIYHRNEGIVLQQLEHYHSELVLFYRKTKNIDQLTPRQLESINKLESSWDDDGSIHVVLSRIKKLFKNAIDEHLAKHYYIEGRPGQPYNIALSQDLIIWGDEDE
jgi:uncharacterized membrane protein